MRVAVMGCGKMAGAITARWVQTGVVPAADVMAVEASEARAAAVSAELGIACGVNAGAALPKADVVLLGIKPQQAAAVLPSWSEYLKPGAAVVSMLAGTPAARVQELLAADVHVVRIMPNTPARIGLGCTAVAWPDALDSARRGTLRPLFDALGAVVELAEDRIDAFTSIAGSGPAYVFLFLEALTTAATVQGFDVETARTMALTTVVGASQLAAGDTRPFAQLRRDVTSPGGTTQEAIAALQRGDLVGLVSDAAQAATARAAALARTT
jgi:pyrroline-5-carboxylate reductase